MKLLIKKTTSFLILILLITGIGFAQQQSTKKLQKNTTEKLTKKQKKLKKALISRKFYADLLKDKLFVMEADQLYTPAGQSFIVLPSLNFFAVKGNKVIFQIGSAQGIGRNGVGGITAEGFIKNYKFNPGKNVKRPMIITGNISPRGGGAVGYFSMTVSSSGNAYLNLVLPFSGNINMSGRIVDYQNASVFKGQSLF